MTHNTREVEEFDARAFIKKARRQNWKNGGVLAYDDDELVEQLENTLHHQLQKAREEAEKKVLSITGDAIEENTAFYEQKYGGNYEQCGRDIKFSIAEAMHHSELDQDSGMPHPYANPEGVYGTGGQTKLDHSELDQDTH